MDWDALDSDGLHERLAAGLARQLPGRLTQRAMTPELAYGRHHGPIAASARQAAVLLVVMPTAEGWSLPALLRPEHMKTHAGQVSLPGGMLEANETVEQAALREFEEELGAATSEVQVLGRLSPVYVFVTNFQITPVVAICRELLPFQPSAEEVAAVIPLSLRELVDPRSRASHTIRRNGLTFRAPHFEIGGYRVWGATSLILAEFVGLLRQAEENLADIAD